MIHAKLIKVYKNLKIVEINIVRIFIKKVLRIYTKRQQEVIILLENKSKALNGENNRRLNLKLALDQGLNAPISEADQIMPESNVTIPSEENVIHAKEWVDNGSRT